MAGIVKKSLDRPDETYEFVHGRSDVVRVGDTEVWRSELGAGWNWDEDLKPYAEGATSCPMTHREYVVAGQIRYLMTDGSEEIGSPGDYLFIEPGHRAWVVGDETCVLIDW
ncbi:MAG: cupin [Chloroflexota bacterium]